MPGKKSKWEIPSFRGEFRVTPFATSLLGKSRYPNQPKFATFLFINANNNYICKNMVRHVGQSDVTFVVM